MRSTAACRACSRGRCTYDATNNLGLHRVMHHYTVVKRDVPDLNLDGKVNATDATTLANNMGTSTTNTGMTTAAQFDAFYLGGNWEKGDHDGNGFVNQADADWLAGRYTALGVTLPDRLAYSGTFETFTNAVGTTGRWKAGRNAQNKLVETGNFKQEATNFLSWSGTGVGASKRSNSFVTVRNQNSAETAAGVNSQARTMQADLSTNIDTEPEHRYVRDVPGAGKHSRLVGRATGVEQSNVVARFSEQRGRDAIRLRVSRPAAAIRDRQRRRHDGPGRVGRRIFREHHLLVRRQDFRAMAAARTRCRRRYFPLVRSLQISPIPVFLDAHGSEQLELQSDDHGFAVHEPGRKQLHGQQRLDRKCGDDVAADANIAGRFQSRWQ